MDLGIAIDLARRSLKDPGIQSPSQPEHVDRTMNVGLGRLDRRTLIMRRGGGTGEIIDLIHFDIERESDIVTHQLEHRVVHQMRDVLFRTRVEVVDAEDLMARFEQSIAEMGAQETGPSRNCDSLSPIAI